MGDEIRVESGWFRSGFRVRFRVSAGGAGSSRRRRRVRKEQPSRAGRADRVGSGSGLADPG